jgi:hypothetical protein
MKHKDGEDFKKGFEDPDEDTLKRRRKKPS